MRPLHTTQKEKDACAVICNDGEKSSPLNQKYCSISFLIFYDIGQSNSGGGGGGGGGKMFRQSNRFSTNL